MVHEWLEEEEDEVEEVVAVGEMDNSIQWRWRG